LDSSETGQCLPLNFDLITRMRKAANSLDPKVPATLLARADEVIE
jgi:hypothetical protein